MTGLELLNNITGCYAAFVCEKNNLLCLGKNTKCIEEKLRKLYIYCYLFDECYLDTLTDEEKGCLIDDLLAIGCTIN